MEILGMQWYDVLMLAVVVMTTLFGFWKGMAWQVTSLASLIVSAMVAIRFGPQVAPMISEQEPWNRFLAMLILYVLTSLGIWILFRLVAGAIDRVRLKEFDRQLGALFGLAKGVLLCVVITFFMVTLSEQARQAVLGTYSGRGIAVLIKNATPVLPEEITNVLGKYLDELDRKLDPATPPEPDGPLDDASPEGPLKQLKDQIKNKIDEKLDEQLDSLKEGAKKSSSPETANQGGGGSSWWR
ncbi:MAG: CvpA family protein [Pirellulales bacterium]|nr:CvpA family protein [Pirellulales bacterium]